MGGATLAATMLRLSEVAARRSGQERDSLKTFIAFLGEVEGGELRLTAEEGRDVVVPGLMIDLLRQVGAVLDRGDGVVVSEVARELTTSEAARMLGVSRPTLINLLDRGEIASHKVGTHRRVALADVLSYRRRRAADQRKAYEALMSEQDDLGIYE